MGEFLEGRAFLCEESQVPWSGKGIGGASQRDYVQTQPKAYHPSTYSPPCPSAPTDSHGEGGQYEPKVDGEAIKTFASRLEALPVRRSGQVCWWV